MSSWMPQYATEATLDNPPHVAEMLWGMVVVLVALCVFDWTVASRTKARWWLCHAFGNAIVVVSGVGDVVHCFMHPTDAMVGPYQLTPLYGVASTHLYHMIAFKNLSVGDYVHHILFAGVICTLAFTAYWGPLQSLTGFGMSGLPGGLDYIMLAMEKHGYIKRITEKVYNARINTWIRSPLILYTAFCAWTAFTTGNHLMTNAGQIAGLCCFIVLAFTNAQYYMQVVVVNVSRKDENYSC
eukprot:CAMPEP_0198337486 /NCGR_PEP_ID=MMETSP1450-20131203/28663_1 /TAXON_ID=753684 ORGANISM="Madagascaria erythrocladiodes, Strain CCMP3234" /NCGR_SAMPLE_ID=MMETSP1450 /ASSEMBLY_ACC=CAM_ASM_001115 /LENGTH=239 /DNA_ID=CAMNT_0044042295 /DNA_START=89 /DNA_END=808 /DNA_ORIENTATION=-